MTLTQYMRIVRTQWILVAALTMLVALGSAAYSWWQTPSYSATAQMFVTTRGSDSDVTTLTQGGTFTQQRVKSYAGIVTAPNVLNPVIQQFKLNTTAEALAQRITASSQLDTVLLDVTVQDVSPTRARDIANAVADQFTTYVQKLELPAGTGTSPVKVTVTTPAVAPTAPDKPRKTLNLAIGLLVGLGLGLGIAVLRDSLDRTIGGRHDAGEVAGAPVLSTVVEDPEARDKPLITHNAFAPRAEAFRKLRTNIRFLSIDAEVRSLVVTSSIEKEGKTSTAANLAVAMAQDGEKVVLIDADLRRPTLGTIFGLPNGVGLTSVLLGDVPLADALQPWGEEGLQLFVLTSGPVPPNPSELVGSHKMMETIEQLVSGGYIVVVDSPPLLPATDAAVLARITNGALLVARARHTRVEQLGAAADLLRAAGAPILGVLVNRVPKKGSSYHSGGYYYGYANYGPRSSSGGSVNDHHQQMSAINGAAPETSVSVPSRPAPRSQYTDLVKAPATESIPLPVNGQSAQPVPHQPPSGTNPSADFPSTGAGSVAGRLAAWRNRP